MKLFIQDIVHKGVYFKEVVFEIPDHIKGLEDIKTGNLESHIRETLDIMVRDISK